MSEIDTLTAAEYSVWLIQTMTSTPDGPEFRHLKEAFDEITDQLQHLNNCYRLPPYETPRSL